MTTTYSNEISDIQQYTAKMNSGIMDKLFWVDKINPDLIVDFGCADGALLKQIEMWHPNASLFGFDANPTMLKLAQTSLNREVQLFSDWEEMAKKIREYKSEKVAIILSSVIHEIYHYSSPAEVDLFWNRLFPKKPLFDYIVIRDMIPSHTIDRPSDTTDAARIYGRFLGTKELADFESIYGTVENNRQMIHFLLKYKYQLPAWEREVRENYFPLDRRTLLSMIPLDYSVLYHEHYVLPYIKRIVRDEVGIDIKDPTHLKLILELTPTTIV